MEKTLSMTDSPGGLLYYSGDSELASLNPAIGAASLLLHYAPMASDQSKADSYVVSFFLPSPDCKLIIQAFAQRQVDYVMGNNPMNGELNIPGARDELTTKRSIWSVCTPTRPRTHTRHLHLAGTILVISGVTRQSQRMCCMVLW